MNTDKIIKLYEIISKIISNLQDKRNNIKYNDFISISDFIKDFKDFKTFLFYFIYKCNIKISNFIIVHKK